MARRPVAAATVAATAIAILLRCATPNSALSLNPSLRINVHLVPPIKNVRACSAARRVPSLPSPSRLCASPQRGGVDGDRTGAATDAARLYQDLAAREARRRRDDAGKNLRSKTKDDVVAPASALVRDDDPEQGSRMRLRLQRLEAELDGGRKATATATATDTHTARISSPVSGEDAEAVRSKMEAELNRLKLLLAEAKREVDEGERRAEDAERRVRALTKGFEKSSSSRFSGGEMEGSGTIESVRRENAERLKQAKADHRRRLEEFDSAVWQEKRSLRNRAWSLETELNKQQIICIAARKDADRVGARCAELEATYAELEATYAARIKELEGNARDGRSALLRTRSRIAERVRSMRKAFREEIGRISERAENRSGSIRTETSAAVENIEERSRRELLVLRRETVDAIAKEKAEKYEAVRMAREERESYRRDIDGRIRLAREEATRRVAAVQEEAEHRIEEARAASADEKLAIREEGRRALASARAEAERQVDKARMEIAIKVAAADGDRARLKDELVGRQATMAEYEKDRSSLRKIIELARRVLNKRLTFRRRER